MRKISLLLGLMLIQLISSCQHRPCDSLSEVRDLHSNEELTILYQHDDAHYLGPLNLDEMIAIALQQNLDVMVKAYEYEIQKELVTGERLKMLPNILYNWEWSFRNKNTGSFSKSLQAGIPPAPPSISSTQTRLSDNFQLVWNLLDFGLAYFRSEQESNKTLILGFEYERLRQNLVLDVTKQYWKAVVSKHAIERGRDLVSKAKAQIAIYEKQMDNRVLPLLIGLNSIADTYKIELEIQRYEKEYHTALSALFLLMALPPNCQFDLIEPDVSCLPEIGKIDMNEFVKVALMNRPELYIGDTQEEIMRDEMRLSLMQMLPGIEYNAGFFQDINKFLIFNNWLQHGVRVIGNLMSIPRQYSNYKSAEWRKGLTKQNRLALSMGIITQLYLSYLTYVDNSETYRITSDLSDTNKRLLSAGIKERTLGKLHDASLLRIAAQELFSEIDALKAYAEVQVAIEQMNNTLGIPRYIFCEECFPKRERIPYKSLFPSHLPDLDQKIELLSEEKALTEEEETDEENKQ